MEDMRSRTEADEDDEALGRFLASRSSEEGGDAWKEGRGE